MAGLVEKVKAAWSLGPVNVARVGAFRIGLRSGRHKVLSISAEPPEGPFFVKVSSTRPQARASGAWMTEATYFSRHTFPLGDAPPDWHTNPFRDEGRAEAEKPWHQIPDFDPYLGDIKTIWEASRFDWLLPMAQRAALGQSSELDRLNDWLSDWVHHNPPYKGANWKCGQEASIRVMHLAATAIVLGQVAQPTEGLRALVHLHLKRIAPTIGYAIGQSNNHGTSEAAALFIGGSWLGGKDGATWSAIGRKWLEDRALVLIAEEGTFSQYSTVYHRVMLDTYSLAEVWRRHLALPAFSNDLTGRLTAAVHWLHVIMRPGSGDAPNLGANDGARLLPLSDTEFRDFRPSLQLASTLFCGARAVAEAGPWDQSCIWLDIPRADAVLPAPQSISLDQGGLHVLHAGSAMAVLRYPRFRFRPSHADALHLDLWCGDENLSRDAGTGSYADETGLEAAGTASHSTVTFDNRDQMPRLGRFLFGAWLSARDVRPAKLQGGVWTAAAGYRDTWGGEHHRAIALDESTLRCTDTLSGTARKAVLRWRLVPGDWHVTKDGASLAGVHLRVQSDAPATFKLSEGWEARHYLEATPIPVLEIETTVPATLTTEISF